MSQSEVISLLLSEGAVWEWTDHIHVLGSAKSGNWGHKGRPSKRGGSLPKGQLWASRTETVPVKTAKGTIYVDPGIAPLVSALNTEGLETGQSCSGHTCDRPIETQVSFKHTVQGEEKLKFIRNVVASDRLNLDWTLIDKPMNWHELYLQKGLYGSQTLPSTSKNIELIAQDLDVLTKAASGGIKLGGPGSGNWGHAGIPGKRGGSAPRGSIFQGIAIADAVQVALTKCKTEGAKYDGEYGIILNSSGEVVLEQVGETGAVIYHDDLPEDASILIHNHPDEGTFSGGDVTMMLIHPQIESQWVVDTSGIVYTLQRTPNTPTSKQLYPDKMSPELYVREDIQKAFDAVVVGEQKAYYADKIKEMRPFSELKAEFVEKIAPVYHLEYKVSEPNALSAKETDTQTSLAEYATNLSPLSEPEKRLAFAEHLIEEGYSFRTDGDRFVVLGSSKSGNYGHAGRPGKRGGSAPRGSSVINNLDGSLSGYVDTSTYRDYMSAEGVDSDSIEAMERLFYHHAGNTEEQARADEELVEHWNAQDNIGRALLATSKLEAASAEAVFNRRISELEIALQDDIKYLDPDSKFYDNYDAISKVGIDRRDPGYTEALKGYIETRQAEVSDFKDSGSLTIYRRSRSITDEPILQSWTTDPYGADTSPLTGGNRIIPDRSITLKDLHQDDGFVISGFARQRGRPGESEVVVIYGRPSNLSDGETVLTLGSSTSGHYHHAGIPGHKGGSLPKGASMFGPTGERLYKGAVSVGDPELDEFRDGFVDIHTKLFDKIQSLAAKAEIYERDYLTGYDRAESLKAMAAKAELGFVSGNPEYMRQDAKDIIEKADKSLEYLTATLDEKKALEIELSKAGDLGITSPTRFTPYFRAGEFPPEIKNGLEEQFADVSKLVTERDAFAWSAGTGMSVVVRPLKSGETRAYAEGSIVSLPSYMAAKKVTAHELGHVLEHQDTNALNAAIGFVKDRTSGESLQSLQKLTGGYYTPSEKSRPDRFVHAYVGKDYGRDATEVVSMGLEMMATNPAKLAKMDPQHFDLMLHIMRNDYDNPFMQDLINKGAS